MKICVGVSRARDRDPDQRGGLASGEIPAR